MNTYDPTRYKTVSPFTIVESEVTKNRVKHRLKCGIEIYGFGPFANVYRHFELGNKVVLDGAFHLDPAVAN